jgi:hypothetical protein
MLQTVDQSVADPTRFTIRQEVLWLSPTLSRQPDARAHAETPVLFTATYRFNYPKGLSSDPLPDNHLVSPEPISDTESSPMLYAFSPSHYSEKESISWCETPPLQDYEAYFDLASYCGDNYEPSLYDGCRRDLEPRHSSPFSLRQRHSPNIPTSPSSSCFPTELCNYASPLSLFACASDTNLTLLMQVL